MRSKIIKTRDAFGQPVYNEYWDLDTILAVAIRVAKDEPENKKANAVVDWLKQLGHKPTDKEFMDWFKQHGGSFPEMPVSEEWEN